jgi:hypothetical protein
MVTARRAEQNLEQAIKGKQLEPLAHALAHAREMRASVVAIREGEQMQARLKCEKQMEVAMDEVNATRPPKTKREIAPLLDALESAMALKAEPKKILKAQAMRRTVEAELKVLQMHAVCDAIEVAAEEWLPKLRQFKQTIEDGKAAGAMPQLVQHADHLLQRLNAELNLQLALYLPKCKERLADGAIVDVALNPKPVRAAMSEAPAGKKGKGKGRKGKKGKKGKAGPEPPPRNLIFIHTDPLTGKVHELTSRLESLQMRFDKLDKAWSAATSDDVDAHPELLQRAGCMLAAFPSSPAGDAHASYTSPTPAVGTSRRSISSLH